MKPTLSHLIITAVLAAPFAFLAACEDKKAPAPAPAPANGGTPAAHDDHDHEEGDDHGHAAGHGGAVIDLGTATIGGFSANVRPTEERSFTFMPFGV